ncbi:hypothetical protein ABTM08_19785, partial [Acinetobacter baumannii]
QCKPCWPRAMIDTNLAHDVPPNCPGLRARDGVKPQTQIEKPSDSVTRRTLSSGAKSENACANSADSVGPPRPSWTPRKTSGA